MADAKQAKKDTREARLAEYRARQELVRRALKLIAPQEDARDECSFDVERAEANIRLAILQGHFISVGRTKLAKKAARRLAVALRRVEIAHDNILKHFPIQGFPRQELAKFRARFEQMASSPSGTVPRMGAEKKRLAAAEAHRLMQKYGARITTTPGSNYCKLAALIYGKPTANLHTQCKAHVRAIHESAKPGSK